MLMRWVAFTDCDVCRLRESVARAATARHFLWLPRVPPGGTCCFITVWFVLIVSGPTRGGLGLICIFWMEANEFGRRLIAGLFRWNWAVPSCAAQFLFKTKKFKREISQTSETHRFTCRTDWNEFKKKIGTFSYIFHHFAMRIFHLHTRRRRNLHIYSADVWYLSPLGPPLPSDTR